MQQATGNWQQQPVSLAHLSCSLCPAGACNLSLRANCTRTWIMSHCKCRRRVRTDDDYSMPPASCHFPLRHLPLATCFDFSTQIHKKNPNANENETNVGVKMKTFVRKRENSVSVCVRVFLCFPLCVCVCACVWAAGSVSSALAVSHCSDVHAWSSLAFWATATTAACRSGSTVCC